MDLAVVKLMTFPGKHLKTLAFMSILIALSVGGLLSWRYLGSTTFRGPISVGDAVVSCTLIDLETGLPVSGIQLEVNLSTPKMGKITVHGVTSESGSVSRVVSNCNDSSLHIDSVVLEGKWIIHKATADRIYSINERLWSCIDAKSFLSGYSKYSAKDIWLHQDKLKERLEFSVTLYASPARMLAVLNPIQQDLSAYIAGSRSLWGRGTVVEMTMTDSNFIEVENTNFVLIAKDHPLRIGVSLKIPGFAWNFEKEFNVTDREFIDLTAPIMREFSNRQIQEATSMLDVMSVQGFDLGKQYEDLEKVKVDYNHAINAFDSANYTEGSEYARNGWVRFFSIYTQIRDIHSKTLPWAITIIFILVFFSFTLARLISGHRENVWKTLVPLVFSPFFLLFSFTQPHLRLFFLSPFIAIEKLDIIFFVNFLAVLPWLFSLLILAITPRFRDLLWETLELSLRNMYRRRLRSTITILTIATVSASAMCVLTISAHAPSISIPLSGVQPTVQQGLSIERYEILTPIPGTITSPGQMPQAMHIQIPLPIIETMWLTRQPWIHSYNVYGLKHVTVSNSTGQSIANFSRFSLIIMNSSFVEEYCAETSNVSWLTNEDKGKVLVGSKIANAYHLSPGQELFIDSNVFIAKDIFDEEQMIKACKEICGRNLFTKVYDPATNTIFGESFIIGSLGDFWLESFSVHKISIIVNSNYTDDFDSIANSILQRGYCHEITAQYDVTRTYKVYLVRNGKVTCRFYSVTESTIAGPWQMQAVLVVLSAAMVSLNVMASVNERKREIQAIFASGATPLRIRIVFIMEALTFGLIGGIYGYVFTFSLIKIGDISLPSSVLENLSSGSPFLISLSTGIAASMVGSVHTSASAVLSVVPSKRMLQKDQDILTRQENRAIVDIPMKLQLSDIESFDSFITRLVKELTPRRFYFDGIGILDVERMEKKEHVTYVLNMNYSAEKNAFYKTAISIRKNAEPKEIEVVVYPLDTMRRIVSKWKAEHNITLSRFAGQLRSDLLKYVGSKGYKQRSSSAK